ncbi:PUA [Glarea lozoyensis ATCC 20868]|uniref:Thymocyte nuclear protein 1 n=1 Tax=Glarea lozoyensis (strain ATCC 20868 / MF5171) TaxID=1116229 RepID=S3DHE6_GLAL2|nr:PUA [Glarea lozoyensis ATCC 20868]EPE26008.1 PUA [Glarea lozoyensis ATCC 20868]
MPKRKAKNDTIEGDVETPRRSSRTPSKQVKAQSTPTEVSPPPAKKSKKGKSSKTEAKEPKEAEDLDLKKDKKEAKNEKASKEKDTTPPAVEDGSKAKAPSGGRQYWLMKAEPEPRMEKGHDISFSIDDLAAKSEPEPWDGIRNFAARNNLRAMKKGDLAFFYHSSCKVPAIVGIMEIVKEHSPDLSAHDSSKPYYDPKSSPDDPKWSVVHVVFRQKLDTPITLKELKDWRAEKSHPLQNMQMLAQSRMSVSKVSAAEWEFLVGQMKDRGDVIQQ